MDIGNIDLSKLTPEQQSIFDAAKSHLEGFAAEDAVALVRESKQEKPGESPEDLRSDSIGKVKHWLRVGPPHLEAGVDFIWNEVAPYAADVIDQAIALDAQETPTV